MKGVSYRYNHICFGIFALQELETSWITSGKIECEQLMITHYAHPGGKIWVHQFPDKPITMRPTKKCMRSRKGSLKYWVFVIRTGQILYEMGGVYETVAREAARIDEYKMPICNQFVTTLPTQNQRPIFRGRRLLVAKNSSFFFSSCYLPKKQIFWRENDSVSNLFGYRG